MPRQQALLKRPDVAKVVNLHVDPESYWIYTNTPPDNARLDALTRHGTLSDALAPAVGTHLKGDVYAPYRVRV